MKGLRILTNQGYKFMVLDNETKNYNDANGPQLVRIKTAIEEGRFAKDDVQFAICAFEII